MTLIPVTLDYYPNSKTNWISAFLSALIPYLNASYFLCLWLSLPVLPILAFFSLCSVNSHFHCQHIIVCFLSLFTVDCLNVTELRITPKLAILLISTGWRARQCWWWCWSWWTFFFTVTLLQRPSTHHQNQEVRPQTSFGFYRLCWNFLYRSRIWPRTTQCHDCSFSFCMEQFLSLSLYLITWHFEVYKPVSLWNVPQFEFVWCFFIVNALRGWGGRNSVNFSMYHNCSHVMSVWIKVVIENIQSSSLS